MMTTGRNSICSVLAILCVQTAAAQWETGFTYQARLSEGGSPANGAYDIAVSLWDASLGGNQVGAERTYDAQPVTDGLLTLDLNFGADPFDSAGRWLQVKVDGTTLAPRQAVTGVPYAIETRGIEVNASGSFVGVGRSSPVTTAEAFGVFKDTNSFGGMYVQTSSPTGDPFYGYSAGGDVDAYHVFDGDTGDWSFVNTGGERMRIGSNGRVGIGTSTPSPNSTLHVASDRNMAVYAHATATNLTRHAVYGVSDSDNGRGVTGIATATTGQAFGMTAESNSSSGVGMFATAASGSGNTKGLWGRSFSTNGTGVLGEATASTGTTYAIRAYAGSSSGYDFYAAGNGINYGAPSSIRWKRNIAPIADPLDKLARIRGVVYDWDEDHGGQHDVGFIGEEVGEVLPEIVAYEADGRYVSGMDYGRMTPLLVEAVKALQAEQITQIAARDEIIRQNQERIAALEIAVAKLSTAPRAGAPSHGCATSPASAGSVD